MHTQYVNSPLITEVGNVLIIFSSFSEPKQLHHRNSCVILQDFPNVLKLKPLNMGQVNGMKSQWQRRNS